MPDPDDLRAKLAKLLESHDQEIHERGRGFDADRDFVKAVRTILFPPPPDAADRVAQAILKGHKALTPVELAAVIRAAMKESEHGPA